MPQPLLPAQKSFTSPEVNGYFLYAQEDYAGALKHFTNLLANTPDDENLLIWASAAAYHGGRGDDYAMLTIAAYERYPSTMTAYNLAVFMLTREDYASALQLAQTVFDHQTSQYGKDLALVLMAHAHMGLGDSDAAEDAILTVAESEKLPLDVQMEMVFLMGQVEMQRGHYGQADIYFSGLIGDKSLGSSAWNELGLIEAARDNIPAAILSFRKAFDADPQCDTPLLNIVNTYQHQQMDAECIPYLEYLVAKTPDDPSLLEFLGTCYRRCGNASAAEHSLRRGLVADPDNRSLQTQLAITLLQGGRFTDESIGLTNDALSYATDTNDSGMAYRALGSVFRYASQAGQSDLARQAVFNNTRLLRSLEKGKTVPTFNPLVLGA